MAKENTSATTGKLEPANQDAKRQRSSIAFPYLDLTEAIAVATAIHGHVGTGTCTREQLAAWINMSPKSSGFRSRMAAADLFDLVNDDRPDAIVLTELGRLVMDPKRQREGRAKAFLSVPLFRAIFEKLKGTVVPPAAALENELMALGVASTLKGTARSVLERSADAAGFYEAGRDRLVLPAFREGASNNGPENRQGGGGGGGDGTPPSDVHPVIAVLLDALPEQGTVWPETARMRWLQALSKALESIYAPKE